MNVARERFRLYCILIREVCGVRQGKARQLRLFRHRLLRISAACRWFAQCANTSEAKARASERSLEGAWREPLQAARQKDRPGQGDVVSYLGVSRSLPGMRFKDTCGKTVIDEILDCRLAEVKRFLRETDRSILQIGRDCGLNDPDNLTRLFRKRYGVSMSEWRKNFP